MAQVKKEEVRLRFLEAAAKIFEQKGYVGTSMNQIADAANLSVANIYNYYPSKLQMAFDIFGPWMEERLNRIEQQVARKRTPRARLAQVLSGLWRDIPQDDNNFFNNFIQALAASGSEDGYTPVILLTMRERITRIVLDCLPPERRSTFDTESFSHMIVMAFDGFVINRHLKTGVVCNDRMIESVCTMVLGEPENSGPAKAPMSKASKRKSR